MSNLSAEIIATCNALGYFDAKSNKYYADGNTLETVKDLIRFLRRDDESHDVRRQLGETKVLQTDLLPLLKSYWEETDLFDVLLRLIVNLTTPALILWGEELPTEKVVRNHYLQIEDHLQSYKEAFADESVWAVLSTKLSSVLEIDHAERGEENSLIIERILILIRNILYVPADTMERRPDNDASIHDQVLWALHQSGMLDIILYITSSANEQVYYMHILEILSFMLREQKASELASAALQRSQTEKIRDEAELLAIRHKESNQKQKKVKMYSGTRHSRFGGTFVVKSIKSISDNELIYHKPLSKVDALNFDVDKKKPKTPKNRLPIVAGTSERRSAFTIRLFLKEFCVEFLNGAYNTLMHHAKASLVRAKTQVHDESYYLWALRFFMEFNRCYKFEVKLVSETMSVQAFHYVQQQSETYFDFMQSDKKKLRLWSRRLHLALLAYRELFLTLTAMDRSTDETVRESARVIKSNIFYVPEYREFVLTLLVTYDELKMSDVYLRDLIETQHVFLKMFEGFCGGKEGSLIVRKKVKGKKRRGKKPAVSMELAEAADLNLEGRWDEAAPQLSIVLERGMEIAAAADVVPFDAASDVPIDDQKADAMKNIQGRLRSGDFENAIGLLRAAREVWPENDSFGSNNMPPEEEFLALRDIFFADLGENDVTTRAPPEELEENEDEYDDEQEEEEGPRYSETDLKFDDFLKRLPHPKIVRACGLALRNFDTNPVNTNHCIVKLLHRIAFDCKMYAMVFQLSIFRTFQRIFEMKDLPQNKELVKFATYIIRQFMRIAENNKHIYMETLFWKSSREAYDVEHGYGSYTQQTSASAKSWSEQEEDELRRLFMEHQENGIEDDVVDWIVNNLIDNTRTRRAVLKKLKEMFLLTDDYKGKKKSGVRASIPQSWGVDEEDQLRELYEEFKDAADPLGCIMPRLEVPRPKNRIVEKMLVMGLIQDKKELRKKRTTGVKSGGRKFSAQSQRASDDEEFSSASDCDGDGISDSSQTTSTSTAPRRAANKNSSKNSRKKTSKKKDRAHVQATRSELVKHLLNTVDSGLEEALEWLKESLSDAIEDFEDGNNEGIPLVPIMDYAQAAMENEIFQRTLKAFGIFPPFDEQEVYWRIPGNLSVDTLNAHCNLLQEALDKTLTVEVVQESRNENVESENEDICNKPDGEEEPVNVEATFDRLKKSRSKKGEASKTTDELFNTLRNESQRNVLKLDIIENKEETYPNKTVSVKKKTRKIVDSSDDDEDGDANEALKEIGEEKDTSITKKGRNLIESDSEGEEEELRANQDEAAGNENKENTSLTRKGRNVIESDSEEEGNENDSNSANSLGQNDAKRIRSISDSDSEKPIVKRSRIIDSDEDE